MSDEWLVMPPEFKPKEKPRPNSFLIGGIRCGTTWLHSALAHHPEVCASKVEKEICYFDVHFDKGEEWYRGFYPDSAAPIVLDASPSYLDGEGVAGRLRDYAPDARLIVILREPVQRAYSHYCRLLNAGAATDDIDRELGSDSAVVRHGFYFRHLEKYVRSFPRDQMLVLFFEDLQRDPCRFLDQVLRFLNISTDFTPPNLKLRNNETRPLKRWPLLHSLLRSVYHTSLRLPIAGPVVFRLRSQNAFAFVHRLNRSPERAYPPLTAPLQQRLRDLYRPEIQALEDLLAADLSHWLRPTTPE